MTMFQTMRCFKVRAAHHDFPPYVRDLLIPFIQRNSQQTHSSVCYLYAYVYIYKRISENRNASGEPAKPPLLLEVPFRL